MKSKSEIETREALIKAFNELENPAKLQVDKEKEG